MKYEIYVSEYGAYNIAQYNLIETVEDVLSYSFENLTPSNRYWVMIREISDDGIIKYAFSDPVEFRTLDIELQTEYNILIGKTENTLQLFDTTTDDEMVVSGLYDNTTYYVQIRCDNNICSNIINFTTLGFVFLNTPEDFNYVFSNVRILNKINYNENMVVNTNTLSLVSDRLTNKKKYYVEEE